MDSYSFKLNGFYVKLNNSRPIMLTNFVVRWLIQMISLVINIEYLEMCKKICDKTDSLDKSIDSHIYKFYMLN